MEKRKIEVKREIKNCSTCGALMLNDRLHTACMLCDNYSNWFQRKSKTIAKQ